MNQLPHTSDAPRRGWHSAGLIALLYIILASLWFIAWDLLLPMLAESKESLFLSNPVKRLSLIGGTALLLYWLLRNTHGLEKQAHAGEAENINLLEIIENTLSEIFIFDIQTQQFVWVNQLARDNCGYSEQELLGKTLGDLGAYYTLEKLEALLEPLRNGSQKKVCLQTIIQRKNGSHYDIDLQVLSLNFHGRQVYLASGNDVTAPKQAEAELRASNRLYRVVSNIGQAIVRHTHQEQVFRDACEIAVRDGGFRMAWIGLLQDDGQVIPVMHAGEAGDYLEHLHISLSSTDIGPTATALLNGQHVICNDIANDPRMQHWREHALALGYRASAAFPLITDSKVCGVFNLYADRVEAFDNTELALLDEVANDIAFAIGLINAEEVNRQTMISLEESQSKLLLSIEAANLGLWDLNLETGLAVVTDSYYSMLGFAPRSFPTTLDWWFSRMHPEDHERVHATIKLLLTENQPGFSVEYRIRHQDDSWHWLIGAGKVAARNTEGAPIRLIGINMDITPRIEAEHQHERDAERANGLLALATAEATLSEKDLLQYGLNLAERITDSKTAFLHFVNADQQTIELAARSSNTLLHCHAVFDQHYPIAQAGIWADCFRQKKAIICNDYHTAADKKGVPEGHFQLTRFISLPAISNDKVQMIMGVGNRETVYTRHDMETVQLIANDLWRIVQRRRTEAALIENLHEQLLLNAKLEEAHNQLQQSEKLAAIGQLAAGVAHELNNPIGFVHSNLGTLESYVNDLMEITETCCALKEQIPQEYPQLAALEALIQSKDYNYIRGDLPQLISESKEGLGRVRRIVQDLKDFSRAGESTWEWADLHKGLDSTLNIVWNELKYKCTVNKEYGELPEVYCLASQLNQVFMNLLVNASHAIEKKGVITIRTGTYNDQVWIEVSDTGKGIPEENLSKIFDPFFTTKPVGQGTGLGLSLSYSIMQRHRGSLTVRSKVGEGTTFRVELPIKQEGEKSREATE